MLPDVETARKRFTDGHMLYGVIRSKTPNCVTFDLYQRPSNESEKPPKINKLVAAVLHNRHILKNGYITVDIPSGGNAVGAIQDVVIDVSKILFNSFFTLDVLVLR